MLSGFWDMVVRTAHSTQGMVDTEWCHKSVGPSAQRTKNHWSSSMLQHTHHAPLCRYHCLHSQTPSYLLRWHQYPWGRQLRWALGCTSDWNTWSSEACSVPLSQTWTHLVPSLPGAQGSRRWCRRNWGSGNFYRGEDSGESNSTSIWIDTATVVLSGSGFYCIYVHIGNNRYGETNMGTVLYCMVPHGTRCTTYNLIPTTMPMCIIGRICVLSCSSYTPELSVFPAKWLPTFGQNLCWCNGF